MRVCYIRVNSGTKPVGVSLGLDLVRLVKVLPVFAKVAAMILRLCPFVDQSSFATIVPADSVSAKIGRVLNASGSRLANGHAPE